MWWGVSEVTVASASASHDGASFDEASGHLLYAVPAAAAGLEAAGHPVGSALYLDLDPNRN